MCVIVYIHIMCLCVSVWLLPMYVSMSVCMRERESKRPLETPIRNCTKNSPDSLFALLPFFQVCCQLPVK